MAENLTPEEQVRQERWGRKEDDLFERKYPAWSRLPRIPAPYAPLWLEWITEEEAQMTEFERDLHRLKHSHPITVNVELDGEKVAKALDTYLQTPREPKWTLNLKGTEHKAASTPINGSQIALVGESGPELVSPPAGSTVYPLKEPLPIRDLSVELEMHVNPVYAHNAWVPLMPGQEGRLRLGDESFVIYCKDVDVRNDFSGTTYRMYLRRNNIGDIPLVADPHPQLWANGQFYDCTLRSFAVTVHQNAFAGLRDFVQKGIVPPPKEPSARNPLPQWESTVKLDGSIVKMGSIKLTTKDPENVPGMVSLAGLDELASKAATPGANPPSNWPIFRMPPIDPPILPQPYPFSEYKEEKCSAFDILSEQEKAADNGTFKIRRTNLDTYHIWKGGERFEVAGNEEELRDLAREHNFDLEAEEWTEVPFYE